MKIRLNRSEKAISEAYVQRAERLSKTIELEVEESALGPKIRQILVAIGSGMVAGSIKIGGTDMSQLGFTRQGQGFDLTLDREYDDAPTAEQVIVDIDQAIVATEQANAKMRATFLAQAPESLIILDTWSSWTRRSLPNHIEWLERQGDKDVRDHLAIVNAEIKRRNDADREAKAAKEAAKEAAKAAYLAERDAWIRAHGSSRLQRLLAEDIPLAATYRDERLAMERPGWRWEEANEETDDLRDATEAALDALDAVRASGVSDARLAWITYHEEDNYRVGRAILSARFLDLPILHEIK